MLFYNSFLINKLFVLNVSCNHAIEGIKTSSNDLLFNMTNNYNRLKMGRVLSRKNSDYEDIVKMLSGNLRSRKYKTGIFSILLPFSDISIGIEDKKHKKHKKRRSGNSSESELLSGGSSGSEYDSEGEEDEEDEENGTSDDNFGSNEEDKQDYSNLFSDEEAQGVFEKTLTNFKGDPTHNIEKVCKSMIQCSQLLDIEIQKKISAEINQGKIAINAQRHLRDSGIKKQTKMRNTSTITPKNEVDDDKDDELPEDREFIDFGHENFDLVFNMMLGIKRSID